jgi:S-adenosylmethionine hydrolase
MAVVTLLTDAGGSDHYVAAIKARLLNHNSDLRIIDISHEITHFDLAHAAFVLRAVFRDFAKGTVHLVAVDSAGARDEVPIIIKTEDHFFVGVDNGLVSLVSDQHPQGTWRISNLPDPPSSFPERDIFAPIAARLASGEHPDSLGVPTAEYKRLIDRQVKATRKQITGNVVRVDHFGNLITNIPRDAFDILSKGKVFTIQFGGEKFRRIHASYNQAEQGECFIIFNSLGLLEIGINRGNASELLGLTYDSAVNIVFED